MAMLIKQKYIKLIFWILAIAVLVLSSIPGSVSHPIYSIQHLDKIAHFGTFFVLSILLLFAYKFSKPFFTTALLMALFGLAIEVLHFYVPRRVFSMYDFAADLLGIIVALIVFCILSSRFMTNS
jgi:VanZ family protein